MAGQTAEPDKLSPVPSAARQSFSQFVAKVLDQLSLSAWLPAAVLVGSVIVLGLLHFQPDRDLGRAMEPLVSQPLAVFLLAVVGLVLTTTVTQAFEFEVIRVLEGYWGDSPGFRFVARLKVARHRRKRLRLARRRDALQLSAFRAAKLVDRGLVPPEKRYIVDLLEESLGGQSAPPQPRWTSWRRRREAESFDWQVFAPAEQMRRLEAVEARINEYPDLHRILPTRLGNTLRSAEDSLTLATGERLENFVVGRWEAIPLAMRVEHDQYRTRLDMYCTLVFVFACLSAHRRRRCSRGRKPPVSSSARVM